MAGVCQTACVLTPDYFLVSKYQWVIHFIKKNPLLLTIVFRLRMLICRVHGRMNRGTQQSRGSRV